jgi:transglutaminase-like putative cysteine protease
LRASHVLEIERGWCVTKSNLLAACCRALGIAARVGYADVRNHLSTARMRERLGTDLFIWHGYTSIRIEGDWVKATPAFNLELCEKFRLKPLEFDGREDSIYHPFDLDGKQHMEYVTFRGEFADVPLEAMLEDMARVYPHLMESMSEGDFDREVAQETA